MDLSPDQLLADSCRRLGFDSEAVQTELKRDESPKSQTTVINHVFNLAEDPERHSLLAGAITMWHLYKEAPSSLKQYVAIFSHLFREDVLQFFVCHMDVLQAHVNSRYQKDFQLNYFTVGTLLDTYLSRVQYDEPPKEIPQFCWLRIAVGEFCGDGLEAVLSYYSRLSDQDCIAASPTIFNMGFKEGASSSCMIYSVDDSLDDILELVKEAGMASKNNAGIGMDFSGLRHSSIGRHGMSKGIIPLLKAWDDLTIYINQGGRRPGAMTASIRVHHYDTPEFISLVDKTGEDRNKVMKIRTSIMLSDLFLKRCTEGKIWTLFCPKQTGDLNLLHGKAFETKYVEYEEKAKKWKRYLVYKATREHSEEFDGEPIPEKIQVREVLADELMTDICQMQLKTGTPYIVHGCNVNRKNNMSNVGPVRSLNLCQEITIPAIPREQTGCCNLSSISLKKFVDEQQFNFKRFATVVQETVRALNRVIDVTQNVSEKVSRSNSLNRPIGIGVSGFAEMCYRMDLTPTDVNALPLYVGKDKEGHDLYSYNSYKWKIPSYTEEALKQRTLNPILDDLNWKLWSCMLYNAYLASMEEAKRFGAYPNFKGSPTSEGRLQYHLWQEEEMSTGRKYPFRLHPADPVDWGQEGSWDWLQEEILSHGLRNALLLTCMPTASTAQILGNTESTEFPMQQICARKVQSGVYPLVNSYMVADLKEIGLWSDRVYKQLLNSNGSILGLSEEGLSPEHQIRLRYLKEKYLTMWEIPQMLRIQLSAQSQVFIDHSQSFNVFMAQPTVDLLKRLHAYTGTMGMKTGMYYLHTRAPNQTLKLGIGTGAAVSKPEVCNIDSKGECIGCQ